MMRFRFAALAALVCLPATASEIQERAIEPLAEAQAILLECAEFDSRKGKEAAENYMRENGLTVEMLGKDTSAFAYLQMRVAEIRRDLASLSTDGVCAKGRYFYGEEGTKIPRLLLEKL